MPKVSVIVPVYNVEKYLGECLDSVLRQTLSDIEIICVNDGSTDGSASILAEYAARDPRIKIITQPNGGLSAARNAGMDVASGEYIYFPDSDDYIADATLERCCAICDRDGLDQLVFSAEMLFEDETMSAAERESRRRHFQVPDEMAGEVLGGADLLEKLLDMKRYCVSVPCRLFRREPLERAHLRFEVGLLHEDILFTPLSLLAARRVGMVVEKFYFRRYRTGSIVTKAGTRAAAARFAARLLINLRLRRLMPSRTGARGGLKEKVLRNGTNMMVRLFRPSVALRALCFIPPTASPAERIEFPFALLGVAVRRFRRAIRRRLCPKANR